MQQYIFIIVLVKEKGVFMLFDEKLLRKKLVTWITKQHVSLNEVCKEIGIGHHTLTHFLNDTRGMQHKTLVKINSFLSKKKISLK